jgi:predicted metal-dependent peptidase
MDIEKAFKRLLIKNPFYGLFCLSMPKKITHEIPTLCVSKNGLNCQLNINPDFWNQHTDDEQIALLTHELSHIALQHMFISNSFSDHKHFNIAADCEVNSYIENLPKDAFTPEILSVKLGYTQPLEKGLGTKRYYEEIQKYLQQQNKSNTPQSSSPSEATQNNTQNNTQESKQENKQENKQGQQEKAEEQYPEEFKEFSPVDDHSSWKEFQDAPEAQKQLISNNINTVLKNTAEQIEKSHGTIPGELEGIIEKLKQKKPEVFNWKGYFRRMLGSIYDVNIKSSHRRPSKRFINAAGIQHRKKVSILIAIDTSGSVSKKELEDFFSEIDYVYKAGARVTIIQCDTKINSIEEYDGKNIPKIKGRGGTSFNPPIEYYIKHRKEYASLIYFTDGESYLPDKKPDGIIWVITSNGYHQDFPGKTIYIPKDS